MIATDYAHVAENYAIHVLRIEIDDLEGEPLANTEIRRFEAALKLAQLKQALVLLAASDYGALSHPAPAKFPHSPVRLAEARSNHNGEAQ